MISKFFHIIDIIVNSINQTMAVLGIAFGVLLAFTNVVLRYVFDMSIPWAGELTAILFVWSAFFAMAYGFKKGTHISVTLLLSKFPAIIAKTFMILANIISVAYLIFVAYFGYELILMLKDFEEINVDLNIPSWIPYIVLPISFGLAAYNATQKIAEISMMDSKDLLANTEHEDIIKETVGERVKNGNS